MNIYSDIQLWALVKESNQKAFGELYERHWERIYTLIYWRIYNQTETQDLVQEIFIHLWEKREQLEIKDSVEGYLYVAARFKVLNYIKARGIRHMHILYASKSTSDIATVQQNGAIEQLNERELKKLYNQEVDKLPGKMKQIFTLSREGNLTIDKIAALLLLSPQTVKNQITAALKKIRQGLEHYNNLILAVYPHLFILFSC